MISITGIIKEGSQFKIATIRFGRKRFQIEKLETVSSFSKKILPSFVVSGIKSQSLLIRHLKLPLKNRKALKKTLPFQLENFIPYSIDEMIASPFYQMGKDQTHAIFYIVSKKNFEDHLKEMEAIDPVWVSSFPMALMRFAHFSKISCETFLILHMGENEVELSLIDGGIVSHNLSLKMGMQSFKEAYEKDYGNKEIKKPLNLTQVSEENHPFLKGIVERFIREMERSLCFLSHKMGQKKIESIFFVGQTKSEFEIEAYLKKRLNPPLTFLSITKLGDFDEMTLKEYAIPIGLALDAWKGDKKSIQFRQNRWIAVKTYQKIKKAFFRTFLLSLSCIFLFFLIGHLSYRKKEKKLFQQIDAFITNTKGTIPNLEKIYHWTNEKEKLTLLDRAIPLIKKDHYYFADPPRVADFLAFLSNHPLLKQGGKESSNIQIDQFSYELVTYPSTEKPFDTYKRKVSLSFTSDNAPLSREFHDAIVENKEWFDQKEEVIWDRKQNEYTFQFFIK